MKKEELIVNLVAGGRTNDLLLILEGESPYNDDSFEGVPSDRDLATLWVMAVYHLRFVAEFGSEIDKVIKNGKMSFAYPEDFSDWIAAGAPGLSFESLKRYLSDHPL